MKLLTSVLYLHYLSSMINVCIITEIHITYKFCALDNDKFNSKTVWEFSENSPIMNKTGFP